VWVWEVAVGRKALYEGAIPLVNSLSLMLRRGTANQLVWVRVPLQLEH
jgi:hypothetical protein